MKGEYPKKIDSKNRLSVPTALSSNGLFLGNEGDEKLFIISKGFDQNLQMYNLEKWRELVSKLENLPISNKKARAVKRFIYSGAFECILDAQGRFVIPKQLLDYAKIDKEVYLIGMDKTIEVWSKELFEKHQQEIDIDELLESEDIEF